MIFSWSIFIVSLVCLRTVSSTPIQQTLVDAFKIISQLLQPSELSPLANFFSIIQQKILQKELSPKGEEGEGASSGLWNHLFQSFGLKAKQTPAVALNFLIFLAQMVGNAFPAKPIKNSSASGKSIFEMVVDQPRVSRLLTTMQSPRLMDVVLSEVGNQLPSTSSDCILQLLCRTSPIVDGMQTSLQFFLKQNIQKSKKGPARGEESLEEIGDTLNLEQKISEWNKMTPMNRFFYFMPNIPDFMSQGELCRKKYSKCNY